MLVTLIFHGTKILSPTSIFSWLDSIFPRFAQRLTTHKMGSCHEKISVLCNQVPTRYYFPGWTCFLGADLENFLAAWTPCIWSNFFSMAASCHGKFSLVSKLPMTGSHFPSHKVNKSHMFHLKKHTVGWKFILWKNSKLDETFFIAQH